MLQKQKTRLMAQNQRKESAMKEANTMGMDLGDKSHEVCILDPGGNVLKRFQVDNTAGQIQKHFSRWPTCRIAIEAGTHSGWISRELEALGYTVIVAQPRAVRAIWARDRKNDKSDAEMLARLLRADAKLLSPIKHRSEKAQMALLTMKARDSLVQVRTKLINQTRGLAKSMGHRLASCDTRYFAARARASMPEDLLVALDSLLEMIASLDQRINMYDREVTRMARKDYPETKHLETVPGVGALTALAYMLTLDDPARFKRSREVGPYLGLVPRQDQSGCQDKQLQITKAGDGYLRRLLIGSAQCILKSNGRDCQLRDWGLRLAARGGKNAKKRAVVAVARKLAILMHKLWVSETDFDPNYGRAVESADVAA
jgi:transposase